MLSPVFVAALRAALRAAHPKEHLKVQFAM
jgi:hypothetical protein